MVKAKVERGSGFRDVLNYALGEEGFGDCRRQHGWLRSTCLGGGVRPVAPSPFRGQAPGLALQPLLPTRQSHDR